MKPGIALVFGSAKKPKESMGGDDEGGEDMPEMPSMEDIAGDLIDAVHAKDKAGVAKALKAASACASENEGEPDADD